MPTQSHKPFLFTMSFRDLTVAAHRQERGSNNAVRDSGVQLTADPSVSNPLEAPLPRRRVVVLHGKVQTPLSNDDDESSFPPLAQHKRRSTASTRELLERSSQFALLSREVCAFQKLVLELESLLQTCGETPANSWRMKTVLQTSLDTSQDLCGRLHAYECQLQPSDRVEQTACVKVHRDFKRAHKQLSFLTQHYLQKQCAEASQLNTIGWVHNNNISHQQQAQQQQDEDFFDRALRQQELEQVQMKLNTVQDLYCSLAEFVDEQQEPVDHIQENAAEAKVQGEAAADEISCFGQRERVFGHHEQVKEKDDDENEKWMFVSLPECMHITTAMRPMDCNDYFANDITINESSDTIRQVDIQSDDDCGEVEVQHVERPEEEPSFAAQMGLEQLQTDFMWAGQQLINQVKGLECGVLMR
jgi:hypothetical protein